MRDLLAQTEAYVEHKLIPFWADRIVEPRYGGFQTNYDSQGKRTEVTEKTLLGQARCIFTLSHAQRLGFSWVGARQMIDQGVDFLFKYYRDPEFDGYYWIVEADGRPQDTNKVVYGHSFVIYALSEYALLTGDQRAANEAKRVFDLLLAKAADLRHGGFYEHFDRQFKRSSALPDGLLNKSLDVHMHLMEAFTTLYEMSGAVQHRNALEDVTELIFTHMLDIDTQLGIALLRPDWLPINNMELDTVWGSDRFVAEDGKAADLTSYGHNIELAWLYWHSLKILGKSEEAGVKRLEPILDHTYAQGIDWQYGGLFVEGPRCGSATDMEKEFWQQAEAWVGFLEAYRLTGCERYAQAFRKMHEFIFSNVINTELGEWYPLLHRDGSIKWDYMGHNWKICYHTLRASCLIVTKLRQLVGG